MAATLEVPNKYLASAPVIVTSPTSRCGTTLVQRLISSADNAFVFGEQIGHDMRLLADWFVGQIRFLDNGGGPLRDKEFESALAGTLMDWRPGLTPPTRVMLSAWMETFYQVPYALTQEAQAMGRPVWGYKFPGHPRDELNAFLRFLPRTRVVYVYRNLFDVLKSAKARKFVATNKDVATLCSQWARNLTEIHDLAGDGRVLLVRYEDLIARREEHIARLEAFTGARGIKPGAFDLKVNTYKGQVEQGYSPDQYIAPAELSKLDRMTVLAKAAPIMERLYGELLKAA
jgi:hypothetical protein